MQKDHTNTGRRNIKKTVPSQSIAELRDQIELQSQRN